MYSLVPFQNDDTPNILDLHVQCHHHMNALLQYTRK